MNVVLVENCEAAKWAATHAVDMKIVALTPEAAYELERRGLTFGVEEDYCDQGALEDLGIRNGKALEELIQWIDDFLGERSTVLGQHPVRLACFHFSRLKQMLDPVSLSLCTLRRILAAETPLAVWFWGTRYPDRPTRALLFPDDDSIYARIAPLLCQQMGIGWKVLPPTPNRAANSGPPPSRRLRPWIHSCLESIPHLLANLQRGTSKGTTVILDRVLFLELLRMGRADLLYWDVHTTSRILAWPPPLSGWNTSSIALLVRRFAEEMTGIWREIADHAEFRRHLTWWDIDLMPVVRSRFQHYLTTMLPDALRLYLQSLAMFRRLRPAVLLSLDYSDYQRRAAAQAARNLGIPVVTVQHGAYGSFRWLPIYHNDLLPSDYVLAWGEGVREHCEKRFPQQATVVPVGSMALDALMRHRSPRNREKLCKQLGLNPRARIVVYCLTNMIGNARYLDSIICSDQKRFATQKAIVQVFREFPETQFVIKLHPNPTLPESPILRFVKDEGIRNCLPVKYVPFSDLLPLADLFVLDSPTTTLLQALTTGKKVLIFNDFFQWEEGALELLQRAAVFSPDWQEFAGILRRELGDLDKAHSYYSDDGFLKHFGTYQNDGKSGERLLNALASIAAAGPRAHIQEILN